MLYNTKYGKKLSEIFVNAKIIKDKKDKNIRHIYDSLSNNHLCEIMDSDNTVLVSRVLVWDVLMVEFNISDLDTQKILNIFICNRFKLPKKYTCNRMIF